jgi:hypothetical protein
VAWGHHRLNLGSGRRTDIRPLRPGQDVAWGDRSGMAVERKRTATPSRNSLHDRVVAHPATGCGSDNNGEGQEATCKKVTGEDPWRQPALQSAAIELTRGKISRLFIDVKRGPKRGEPDALRLDALDAG